MKKVSSAEREHCQAQSDRGRRQAERLRELGIDPLSVSVAQAALLTGESQWTVRDKIWRGVYQAKKSGRRTLVVFASVKAANEALPDVQPRSAA